jgi:hypothetical protein
MRTSGSTDQGLFSPAATGPTRSLAAAATIVCATLSASCTDTPTSVPAAADQLNADLTSETVGAILQEQPLTIIYLTFPSVTVEAADDLLVPAGTRWTLTHALLYGGQVFQTSTVMELAIYADGGGVPGEAILRGNVSPVSDTEYQPGSFCCGTLFALPSPVKLMPGAYWLGMRPISGPGVGVLWQWIAAYTGPPSGPIGSVMRFRDPDVSPTEWRRWPSSSHTDLAFVAYGSAGTPSSLTTDLLTTLGSFGLAGGTETSLRAKVRRALDAIAVGDTGAACRALQDLMNEATALAGKKLTQQQVDMLANEVIAIRTLLGC